MLSPRLIAIAVSFGYHDGRAVTQDGHYVQVAVEDAQTNGKKLRLFTGADVNRAVRMFFA